MPVPHEVLAVSPFSGGELVVEAVSVAATVVAFKTIHKIYSVRVEGHRTLTALLPYGVALCISFIPVMLLAYIFEGREMWLPGQHSAVFFIGDGLLLPLMAVAFGRMRRMSTVSSPLADNQNWRNTVIILAIAVSYVFHLSQYASWSYDALHAPSKVWHDFFVYPIFIYYLGSQLPYFLQGAWRRRPVLQTLMVITVVFGFVGWYGLANVYDPHHTENTFIVASGPLR